MASKSHGEGSVTGALRLTTLWTSEQAVRRGSVHLVCRILFRCESFPYCKVCRINKSNIEGEERAREHRVNSC